MGMRRTLNKNDAPLKIQFKKGYHAFQRGAKYTNPYRHNSMQYREWERGYNKAYFENLRKVKYEEQLRTVSN